LALDTPFHSFREEKYSINSGNSKDGVSEYMLAALNKDWGGHGAYGDGRDSRHACGLVSNVPTHYRKRLSGNDGKGAKTHVRCAIISLTIRIQVGLEEILGACNQDAI
jgi:hypothetical protein